MILNYRMCKFAPMFRKMKLHGNLLSVNKLLLGLAFWLCTSSAFSQETIAEPNRKYEFEIRNDNDMYLMIMQDQYYTNGLFLNLRKKSDSSKLVPREKNRIVTWKLGHEMYNSYTAQIDSLEAIDRPISAYLFVGVEQSHYFDREDLLSYSFTVGTIGKRAIGEKLQATLHNLLNMYHAAGWEYQLRNAWMVNLSFTHNKRLIRTKGRVLDISWQTSGMLGTFQTYVKSGPLFRLGKLSPFDQSAHFNARLQATNEPITTEWYAYYRPEGIIMIYDASMQGGLNLRDKGPATAKPNLWQLSNQFGVVYSNPRSTFKIQYFFNTKESKSSLFRHQYGSLTYGFRF